MEASLFTLLLRLSTNLKGTVISPGSVPVICSVAVDSAHPGLAKESVLVVTSYRVSGAVVMRRRKERLSGELERRWREEERR